MAQNMLYCPAGKLVQMYFLGILWLGAKEPARQLFAPQNLEEVFVCQAFFPQVFAVLMWTKIMHSAIAVVKPSMTVFQPMHLCLNQWTNDQVHSF